MRPRHIVSTRGEWCVEGMNRRAGPSAWLDYRSPGTRVRPPLLTYVVVASLTAALVIGAGGCVGAPKSKEVDSPAHAPTTTPQRPAPVHNITLCIVENGALKTVAAVVDTSRGDTLVDGRSWREVYPAIYPPYALGAPWLAREIIVLDGRYYAPYGLPDVIAPQLLMRVGEFRGVPVFAERDIGEEVPSAIFVPTRPGCEFQPYVGNVDFSNSTTSVLRRSSAPTATT